VWVEDENDGSSLSGMCLSPDRSMLYVADRAGVVHVLDTRASGSSRVKAKSKAAQKLQLSENAINSLSINPMDGHMLASAGKDRSVRVWDLRAVKTDKPLNSWAHNYSVNSVEFSPSGRMVSGSDKPLRTVFYQY
jgi:WD40 repeat protein